jgi:NADPH-dependent 2,4-dienoyl-CoA reductase/sulfur reductase-like enzyme
MRSSGSPWLGMLLGALLSLCGATANPVDVLVYGATVGGTMAAIAAAKQGASVVLYHLYKIAGQNKFSPVK